MTTEPSGKPDSRPSTNKQPTHKTIGAVVFHKGVGKSGHAAALRQEVTGAAAGIVSLGEGAE